MRNLFCGCNHWRMCLMHSAVSEEAVFNGVRWIRVDHHAEYSARCRAVAVVEQFRKVLGVVGWVAATDHLGLWPLTAEKFMALLRKHYSDDYVRSLAESA